MGSLYTPFAGAVMGDISGAIKKRRIGKATEGAYMGDEESMAKLQRYDPDRAQQIQSYKDQQAQQDLQNQRQKAADERAAQQQQRAFAQQNVQLMQDLQLGAGALEDYDSAKNYTAAQVNQLRSLGFDDMPDLELTPEAHKMFRTMYQGTKELKPQGSHYLVKDEDGTLYTASIATDDKGNISRSIIDPESGQEVDQNGRTFTRVHALDPGLARQIAGSKEQGKTAAARDEEWYELGLEAHSALPEIDQTLDLISTVEKDGWGTSGVTDLAARASAYLGLGSAEANDINLLRTRLAQDMFDKLANFPGALSNKELGVAERVSAGTTQPGEVNDALLKSLRKKTERYSKRGQRVASKLGYEWPDDAPAAAPSPPQQQQAPQQALEYLRANPDSLEFFVAKYGYTPEGM